MLDALTASPPISPVWNCFLPASVALPLKLRAWREGDRIELTGGGSKKLGDIFTDAKVPSCFRPAWAVLTDANDNLLWVPGLADSAAMALGPDARPEYLVTLKERG
jgi:tRNA(Ile)-lysidine synthase